jgi:hypothetical protein
MKFLAFLAMLFPMAASAADIEYLSINLMQPKNVIMKKVGNIDGLSTYVKQIETDIKSKLASSDTQSSWGFLVIAVRSDGKIKAWLDTDDAVAADTAKTMVAIAESTPAFAVSNGAVVLSLGFGIGGAALPPNTLPFPTDWKTLSKCNNEDCQQQDVEALVLQSMK